MKRRINLFIVLLCLSSLTLLAWTPRSSTGAKAASLAPSVTPTAGTCPDVAPLRLATDYWISKNPNYPDSTWFNAIFIKGLIETYRLTNDSKYLNYATGWARHNKWSIPTNAPNYDGPEAGQEFIDLYELDSTHPAKDIANIQAYLTKQTARVQGGKVSDFSYVDAVRLGAMSAFARLGVPNHNQAEIDAMAKMFAYTESHIYDKKASLWWRDSRWAGTTTHWSRGNGWIVIALTDTIAALPAGDINRAHYISLLQSMAAVLKTNQQSGGYWTADVDHPASYPASEETGTAFFTYGLSRGIQMGYLSQDTYLPVVQKAWNWLRTKALHSNGLVGYVQGPASHPDQYQPISADATKNYGVGAFLMAGVEASKFTAGC